MITDTQMKKVFEATDLPRPPKTDDIVEGTIINNGKACVYLDLGPQGTGIIYGREFYDTKDKLKTLKVGDTIFAKVVATENENGYVELSLTKAGKQLAWDTLRQKKDSNEMITVRITGANKGGLLADVSDIPAFLPVSQLSTANYPKVEGGDNQKILKLLQKFVGQDMDVKILALDEKEEKLILSEKEKEAEKVKEILKKYQVGDVVDGEITGVVDFGAFIKFGDEGLEGLIHISELDWQLIENPSEIVKVGEKVKAKIINISGDKVSLSLKALKKDPWTDIDKKYKKGDAVKGLVTKLNPFGAFIQIMDDDAAKIQGLCHISELGSQTKMEESLKVGETYNFQVVSVEPSEHRMSLKLATE